MQDHYADKRDQIAEHNDRRIGSVLDANREICEKMQYDSLNKVVVNEKRAKTNLRKFKKEKDNEFREKLEKTENRFDQARQKYGEINRDRRHRNEDMMERDQKQDKQRKKRIASQLAERDQLTEKRNLITGEVLENNARLDRFKEFRNYKVMEKHEVKSRQLSEFRTHEKTMKAN